MKRTIILRAASEVLPPGGSLYPGSSPYPWTPNTPSKTLPQVWNVEPGSIVSDTFALHWPGSSPAAIAVGMEKPPTLATFLKVTVTTGFDYQQAKGNGWWFPDDNDHGPAAAIYFRKRDRSTWLTGSGAAQHTMAVGEPHYVNPNVDPSVFRLYTLTWEMMFHPEGGPFTFEDLLYGAFGVVFSTSNGPNGKAYDQSVGGFSMMRVPYLQVALDIDDLGGYTRNVAYQAALWLRLMRRARNVIRPKVSAEHVVARQGERVYLSHPRGPAVGGHGWGQKRLEARSGLILKRAYQPEAFTVTDEVLDMRPIECLGWAAYRVRGPWSPELPGLALLDKGRGFVHDGPEAWARRAGDGVIMRVPADFPSLSEEGLAISGADDVAACLYNWDLMQTGWSTVSDTGDFSAEADLTVYHAEEQGYLSSCKLTYGAATATGGRESSLGTFPRADGDRLHVRVIVRNTSVPDPETQCGEWYLGRSGGGLAAAEYWDEAGREWTTTPTYQAIPSTEPSGESVADAIPCDAPGASSDPTYVIGVGRFSAAMGPVILHAGIVDVQHTDDTVAGCRPSLVTLAAPITRVADSHTMEHVWGRELWVHERGTVVCEVRPWWRAADLPDDAVKPLMHAQHATDTYDALQFVAVAAGADLIRFERAISGETTYQLDCPLDVDLTRAHVLRAWARWLGAESWTEFGPYSVEVGWLVTLEADGSVVSSGHVLGRMTSEVAVPYSRDYVGVGCDAMRQLDGHVRMWETRRGPLHRLECEWRV